LRLDRGGPGAVGFSSGLGLARTNGRLEVRSVRIPLIVL
jgi:hypothetical protein